MKRFHFTAILFMLFIQTQTAWGLSLPETPSWYDRYWYRKPLIHGLLYYSKVKNFLMENNVLPNEDFNRVSLVCGKEHMQFRTYDGTCNDFSIPLSGAAGTAFNRNTPQGYVSRNLAEPDPREISLKLFTRKQFIPNQYSNLLAASFLQFTLHDWISHEDNYEALDSIPLKSDDPIRTLTGQSEILIPKTTSYPSNSTSTPLYRNQATHWFDASQLYGHNEKRALELREMQGGRLKLEGHFLPQDQSGQEQSGDIRNWWLGLSLMHNLFAREHNLIAGKLAALYPQWNDERLYQTSRLIVSAETVKLFMTELATGRFENEALQTIALGNWYGPVNNFINFKRHGLKTPANPGWEKILFDNATLTGLIGSKQYNRHVGFSMTEEWAQVYKYHTLIPDFLELKGANSSELILTPTENTRGAQASQLVRQMGFANLIKSFGAQASGKVTLHNFPKFLQQLQVPVLGVIDVGALDIYRERERGILRFNDFRRQLGLAPYRSITEMTQDSELASEIASLYGDDIEKVDLTVGLMAEAREDQFELGETTIQSLALLAIRRIESDRFFTTNYNAETYTKFGIHWIDELTFKDLLLRHLPELEADLKNVNNPFRRWR